jgi:hypothetical protein
MNRLIRVVLFFLFCPIVALGATWALVKFYFGMGSAHTLHELLLLHGMIVYVEASPAPEDKPE